MFNIYYINYEKAYEIAMLIDNKILEQQVREKNKEGNLTGTGGTNLDEIKKLPFIGKYMPEIKLEGELSGSKSHRVIDTVKVITTKSTILDKIYQNSTEVEKLTDKTIGKLIKIKNVPLVVKNENDILGAKTMLSGALGDIPVDGIGSINMGVLLDALFKNLSYILEGKLPKKRFKKEEMIFIKIPMQVENELEHQYNISDIEIGEVTLIGIYRGFFIENELIMRLNRFSKPRNKEIYDPGIESDEDDPASSNGIVHYLDIIAIVQDISF